MAHSKPMTGILFQISASQDGGAGSIQVFVKADVELSQEHEIHRNLGDKSTGEHVWGVQDVTGTITKVWGTSSTETNQTFYNWFNSNHEYTLELSKDGSNEKLTLSNVVLTNYDPDEFSNDTMPMTVSSNFEGTGWSYTP